MRLPAQTISERPVRADHLLRQYHLQTRFNSNLDCCIDRDLDLGRISGHVLFVSYKNSASSIVLRLTNLIQRTSVRFDAHCGPCFALRPTARFFESA
jgi:hypothetical protein